MGLADRETNYAGYSTASRSPRTRSGAPGSRSTISTSVTTVPSASSRAAASAYTSVSASSTGASTSATCSRDGSHIPPVFVLGSDHAAAVPRSRRVHKKTAADSNWIYENAQMPAGEYWTISSCKNYIYPRGHVRRGAVGDEAQGGADQIIPGVEREDIHVVVVGGEDQRLPGGSWAPRTPRRLRWTTGDRASGNHARGAHRGSVRLTRPDGRHAAGAGALGITVRRAEMLRQMLFLRRRAGDSATPVDNPFQVGGRVSSRSVHGDDPAAMVRRALELIGGVDRLDLEAGGPW